MRRVIVARLGGPRHALDVDDGDDRVVRIDVFRHGIGSSAAGDRDD